MTFKSAPFDAAAIGLSGLCLLHCLALPLAVAALPALGAVLDLPETVHLWLALTAIPLSGWAISTAFAAHRRLFPAVAGMMGLALLLAGAVWLAESAAETPVTVLGSLLLATAHVANWRMRYRG